MKTMNGIPGMIVAVLFFTVLLGVESPLAQVESMDETYKKALKEEGVLNCYCSLAQINAEKIYPVFEKRFPGIRINHVDATADKLAARAITEARGGRVIADVLEFGIENINQVSYKFWKMAMKLPNSEFLQDKGKAQA